MKLAADIFPISKVEQGLLISRRGDLTAAFELQLPEIFTLSNEDFEQLHRFVLRAIKVFGEGTILHQKDLYRKRAYSGAAANGFLAEAANRHFEGRSFLAHRSFLFITQTIGKTGNSLLHPVPKQLTDPAFLASFMGKLGQFERILSDSGLIGLRRLNDEELTGTRSKAGIIENYCFGDSERPVIQDVVLKEQLQVGGRYASIFSLADADDLPGQCAPRMDYPRYSTDRTKFPIGFAANLNLLLNCDHDYDQYIFIGNTTKTLKDLEAKQRRLRSLSGYSRENAAAADATNEFLQEAVGQGRQPVRAHFRVTVWADELQALPELRNQVSAAMAQTGASAKEETIGAPQLWWAGIPGNAAELPVHDTFATFLEQACCFLNVETNYRSDDQTLGFRFCDRFGKPTYVDLYDAVRQAGITSNMGTLVAGTSGAGKSVVVNHLLETFHRQDAHCVIVDIGGSYKGLCELVGGYYFTYEETKPICFNPFYTTTLDTEKKESLKALLVALWKPEHEQLNRSEYVALSNALQGYYQSEPKFPCFNSFYDYLLTYKVESNIPFDLANFLYVLRPYYKGGEFDYLLNAEGNLDLLNQPFVVIELDNIKDHPILFPVVTLIIMELFLSKMRKLPGIRKVLCIDEAWKAIAKSGMAEFLKYAFKTIRKFNGVPMVITQELDDLVSSPIIKDAIINNADIKILLDMRRFLHKFDKLQDTLGLPEKAKAILLSVNKDDRELCIDIGGQITKVYRNELCPEELLAFTTEGKQRVLVQEAAAKYGSMEAGIKSLL